jgi:hypothetical protein
MVAARDYTQYTIQIDARPETGFTLACFGRSSLDSNDRRQEGNVGC